MKNFNQQPQRFQNQEKSMKIFVDNQEKSKKHFLDNSETFKI